MLRAGRPMTRLARWWAHVVEVVEFRHARAVHRLPRSPFDENTPRKALQGTQERRTAHPGSPGGSGPSQGHPYREQDDPTVAALTAMVDRVRALADGPTSNRYRPYAVGVDGDVHLAVLLDDLRDALDWEADQ